MRKKMKEVGGRERGVSWVVDWFTGERMSSSVLGV
jgi:hypothetical protein